MLILFTLAKHCFKPFESCLRVKFGLGEELLVYCSFPLLLQSIALNLLESCLRVKFGLGEERCAALYKSMRKHQRRSINPNFGGLKWTRTTDLTLIRRAL